MIAFSLFFMREKRYNEKNKKIFSGEEEWKERKIYRKTLWVMLLWAA